MQERDIVRELLAYFQDVRERPGLTPREQLSVCLTQLSPVVPLPAAFHALMDELLEQEHAQRELTYADQLPRITGSLYPAAAQCSLWRGDITTLVADAIVNAANDQLLGCFIPFHRCIDNAIHAVAGPGLREACYEIMQAQGHREPTGQAKMTGGYHLPAKYVLHTVGPIVQGGMPTLHQQSQLAGCYTACLALAKGCKSVAFCCISTGMFGYPAEQAAMVALQTVQAWLAQHPSDVHVVFNVFSERDYAIYDQLLKEWK